VVDLAAGLINPYDTDERDRRNRGERIRLIGTALFAPLVFESGWRCLASSRIVTQCQRIVSLTMLAMAAAVRRCLVLFRCRAAHRLASTVEAWWGDGVADGGDRLTSGR